ncbi:MAG: hypothetical protein QXU48_01780 [Thermoplasmata archaeon]
MQGKVWIQTVVYLCALWLCLNFVVPEISGEKVSETSQLPMLSVQVSLNRTEVPSGETLKVSALVTSGGTGVEGVYVEFWLSQEGGVFNPPNTTTDALGKAETVLTTPITQVTLVCSISVNAAKEGYESAMNTSEFTLLPLPKLEVSITADTVQVYNNQSVNLTVQVSSEGQPVNGATVRMALAMGLKDYGEEYFQPNNGTTNAEGKFFCMFSPPVVANETEFGVCVSAYADGFTENTTSIVIKVLPETSNGNNQPPQKTPDYTAGLAVFVITAAALCTFVRRRMWE